MVVAVKSSSLAPGSHPQSISRVLVVDDSRLQRRILSRMLEKWGLEVFEAESGEAALEEIEKCPPDLILSDWMMPGISGLELCRAVRGRSTGKYCYFILLTSKSEKGEIAQGLDAGSDDFVTKPVDANELRARITAGDRIIAMQNELSGKNEVINKTLAQLRAAYDRIDEDLKQAQKLQASLVPEWNREFGASDVSLLLKQCGHIGGDLVGMFAPSENQVAVYGIDVSGHGIASAMMTARLGGLLSPTHFDQNIGTKPRPDGGYALTPPSEVARKLNQRLAEDFGTDEYFTMAYACIDLTTGMAQLVQAGHPHPVILRRGGSVEFVGKGGVPIGLVANVEYAQVELQLCPGDRLLFYSDGITECRAKSGGMIEQDGLRQIIMNVRDNGSGSDFLNDLFWLLTRELTPGAELEDDISALLFRYHGR